jgi:hypothetical protein
MALSLATLTVPKAFAQQDPIPTFGTTVVIPFGLRGLIYYIRSNTTQLPDLHKLKPRGRAIYTETLNVPPQNFEQGFPGVTKRFEWFAIDYTGRFWIDKPGMYNFELTSDDGSKLYIDAELIVDNDGVHPPRTRDGSVALRRGIHSMRVEYFQGPREQVALILKVARPGEDLRIFSTEEFKPPPNPADWVLPDSN